MAGAEQKVVLGVVAEVEVDEHNASSSEEANGHSADMDYTVGPSHYYNTVEVMVADGNSSRCTGACTHCTEVPPAGMAEFDDYKVFFFPCLVAYLALPADDDRSSCRLSKVRSFQTCLFQVGLDWKGPSRGSAISFSLDGGGALLSIILPRTSALTGNSVSISKKRATTVTLDDNSVEKSY